MMKENITCYFAASLFSTRDRLFNRRLCEQIESNGVTCILPQRDGFEFSILGKILDKSELEQGILQELIYLLDIGVLLPKSDIVLAVLDEPMDEGVIVEICYAKMLGIPVIGVRTDSKAPFGEKEDKFGGGHFFPIFQCTRMIFNYDDNVEEITNRFINHLQRIVPKPENHCIPEPYVLIKKKADIIFNNITKYNNEDSIKIIVQRLRKYAKSDLIPPG